MCVYVWALRGYFCAPVYVSPPPSLLVVSSCFLFFQKLRFFGHHLASRVSMVRGPSRRDSALTQPLSVQRTHGPNTWSGDKGRPPLHWGATIVRPFHMEGGLPVWTLCRELSDSAWTTDSSRHVASLGPGSLNPVVTERLTDVV